MNEIVQRHEMLRMTFLSVNGFPAQHVEPFVPFSLTIMDLTDMRGDASENAARQYAIQEAQALF